MVTWNIKKNNECWGPSGSVDLGVVRVIAGDRMYYHRDPQQKLWCYAVILSAANVQSEQRSRSVSTRVVVPPLRRVHQTSALEFTSPKTNHTSGSMWMLQGPNSDLPFSCSNTWLRMAARCKLLRAEVWIVLTERGNLVLNFKLNPDVIRSSAHLALTRGSWSSRRYPPDPRFHAWRVGKCRKLH